MNSQVPKEIKRIVIETIPHKDQRYNTCGDWFFGFDEVDWSPDDLETLHIRVSETGNWKWNMALALHELSEAILCTAAGISDKDVDKFDSSWKPNFGFEEPGNDTRAPYYLQHAIATSIEELLLSALDTQSDAQIEWAEYEACLEKLQKEYDNEPVGPTEETDGDR